MTTKEALKNAIDNLSDKEAIMLYQYLFELKASKKVKNRRKIPSFKLRGKLDNQDIRTLAHEE